MVSSACFFFNFKVPKDNHFLFLSSKVSGTQVLQQHHSSMNLPLHLTPSVQSQRGIHNPSGVPQQGWLTWEGSKGGWFGPRGGGELREQWWNWGNSGSGYTCNPHSTNNNGNSGDPSGRAGGSWKYALPDIDTRQF